MVELVCIWMASLGRYETTYDIILFVYSMGNDVLPATQIAGLVSRAVFLMACEEEMYIPQFH